MRGARKRVLVNLCQPQEVTIKELAERIIGIAGSASAIAYHPLPQDDPVGRRPDITLARTLLGREPKIGLDHGLKSTFDYFRVLPGV